MKLTAEEIIKLIESEYNINIVCKSRLQPIADLRSIFFVLCKKYLHSLSELEIGFKINRKRANVITMSERMSDRLQHKSYKDLRIKFSNLCELIESKYDLTEHEIIEKYFEDLGNINLKRKVINLRRQRDEMRNKYENKIRKNISY